MLHLEYLISFYIKNIIGRDLSKINKQGVRGGGGEEGGCTNKIEKHAKRLPINNIKKKRKITYT